MAEGERISQMTLLEEATGEERIPVVAEGVNAALTPLLILGLLQAAEPYVDEEDLGRDGLMSALDKAALEVAAEQADTAVQPPAVSALAIVAGAITTPLDGNHRTLQLSEDVSAGWTAPLPSGGDASMQVYWCSLDILAPASGGPFALSIPGDWVQAGPLDTIALAAGDDPITVVLRTWGASGRAYSAGWATL